MGPAPATSPHRYSSLPDGSYRFEVRAVATGPDPTPAVRTFEAAKLVRKAREKLAKAQRSDIESAVAKAKKRLGRARKKLRAAEAAVTDAC